MNEIEKAEKRELAWNGKPIRNSEEEVTRILAPMFASFPQTKADGNTVDNYVTMLLDIPPAALEAAVLKVKATCKFFPTIAEIREAAGANKEQRPPGPRNDVDPHDLKPVPQTMYRLDPEEDRRQRMAQLRRTAGWGYTQ